MAAAEQEERGGWPAVGPAEEGRSREEKVQEKPWIADLGIWDFGENNEWWR